MATIATRHQLPFDQGLHDLLCTTQIAMNGHESDLLVLQTDDPVYKALQQLTSRHVRSAPVWDPAKKQWAGLVDLRHFLAYALYLHDHKILPYLRVTDDQRTLGDILQDLATRQPIDNLWLSVNDTSSLLELLQRFFVSQHHRLPVISPSDSHKLVGIVSQSDLIRFVYSHADLLSGLFSRRLRDLGLLGEQGDRMLLVTTLSTPLIDVYRYLLANQVAGCGVVDQLGRLVGTVSVSDATYCLFDLKNLDSTIQEFLKSTEGRHFPVYVHEDATLGDVLKQTVQCNIHRVFVCDSSRRPTGMVTLTDIICALAQMSSSTAAAQA